MINFCDKTHKIMTKTISPRATSSITTAPPFRVNRIIKGFEFGHGTISTAHADSDTMARVDTLIHRNKDILVPVEIDDDGCGDGREVLTIFSYDQKFKRSLNRAKVFGGAATMATACAIGMGHAGNRSLNELFEATIAQLDRLGIDFGAHTDEHMHGHNCGCGAIDKAPQIVLATLKYELPIRGAITLLINDIRCLNEVYACFRAYAPAVALHPRYSGMKVMERILDSKHTRVVKQLGGTHKECRIVLNTLRGFTVNQRLIREQTDNRAQIFGVDVWRMEDLAKKLCPNDADGQHKALLGELIYTLATAAVLTKGDLPVDVIQPAVS